MIIDIIFIVWRFFISIEWFDDIDVRIYLLVAFTDLLESGPEMFIDGLIAG